MFFLDDPKHRPRHQTRLSTLLPKDAVQCDLWWLRWKFLQALHIASNTISICVQANLFFAKHIKQSHLRRTRWDILCAPCSVKYKLYLQRSTQTTLPKAPRLNSHLAKGKTWLIAANLVMIHALLCKQNKNLRNNDCCCQNKKKFALESSRLPHSKYFLSFGDIYDASVCRDYYITKKWDGPCVCKKIWTNVESWYPSLLLWFHVLFVCVETNSCPIFIYIRSSISVRLLRVTLRLPLVGATITTLHWNQRS